MLIAGDASFNTGDALKNAGDAFNIASPAFFSAADAMKDTGEFTRSKTWCTNGSDGLISENSLPRSI